MKLRDYHQTSESWCLKGNRPIDWSAGANQDCPVATPWPAHILERLHIMRKTIEKRHENDMNIDGKLKEGIRNMMISDSIEANKVKHNLQS